MRIVRVAGGRATAALRLRARPPTRSLKRDSPSLDSRDGTTHGGTAARRAAARSRGGAAEATRRQGARARGVAARARRARQGRARGDAAEAGRGREASAAGPAARARKAARQGGAARRPEQGGRGKAGAARRRGGTVGRGRRGRCGPGGWAPVCALPGSSGSCSSPRPSRIDQSSQTRSPAGAGVRCGTSSPGDEPATYTPGAEAASSLRGDGFYDDDRAFGGAGARRWGRAIRGQRTRGPHPA